jgi:hypothetical protein
VSAEAALPFAVPPLQIKAIRPSRKVLTEVDYGIDETQAVDYVSLTPKTFEHTTRFNAASGFRIFDAGISHVRSETRAGPREVTIAEDGSHVTVKFDLTSGPTFDQWRGWFKATLSTRQEAIFPADASVLDGDLKIDRFGSFTLPASELLTGSEDIAVSVSGGALLGQVRFQERLELTDYGLYLVFRPDEDRVALDVFPTP